MGGALLTATLIVRDEARNLPACLISLDSVADEVVVVDTGSVDDSVAIARSLGAHVHHEPWTGDFSRARNAALERARGDWILYIDADERLRPMARAVVEGMLAHAEHVAYRTLLRPFRHSTPYREYRLWRNDPRIRFQGVIHEKVAPAIHAVAEADGRSIGDCDLALEHIGYDGDQAHKHCRNLPLLRAQLAAEPDNVFNWRHLAVVLSALGDSSGAERALWQAVELTRAAPAAGLHGRLAYAELARTLHERGEDVRGLVDEALERYPTDWLLVWIKARLEIDDDHHESALDWLDRLTRVDVTRLPDSGVAYDERLFGSFAHASRGLCLFRLGRYREAAVAYGRAERCEPESPEHRFKARLATMRARGGT